MSYKNLEIWQEARKLVIDIHKMSLKAIKKRWTRNWALGAGYWVMVVINVRKDYQPAYRKQITQNPVTRTQKLFINSTNNRFEYKFYLNIEIPIQ